MQANKPNILIIDDEPDIRHLLTMTLIQMGLDVASAKDVAEAKLLLNQEKFHFCLTDLKLPDGNGLEIVQYAKKHLPEMPIAVITAFGNTETAIEAMKLGAFDFLSKPIDLSHLRQLLKHAFKFANLITTEESIALNFLAGNSEIIRNIRAQIKQLKGTNAPVIIQGAKGTEKERVAKLIHSQSSRADYKAVSFDCALAESHINDALLFGNIKGQRNRLLSAHNSTLIISNVHMLSHTSQKKLVQVLEEKTLNFDDASENTAIDVRTIICTELPLEHYVTNLSLREDLYYRINILTIALPSVKDRHQDIELLIESYLREFSEEKTLSNKAKEKLLHYDYPFNYRELENILEKASVLSISNLITDTDIILPSRKEPSESKNERISYNNSERGNQPLDRYIEAIEKAEIEMALEKTRWNRTEAAKLLGISFRTIRYKMNKLGID